MSRSLFIVVLFSIAPNLGAAPVPKVQPKESLYFPIKLGAKWVYDVDGKEVTETVTGVKQNDEKKRVWIVTVGLLNEKGKVADEVEWEVSDEGLLVTGINGDNKQQPTKAMCVLKLPHKPGTKWELFPKSEAIQMVALEPQRLKVPAGEFEAVGVEERRDEVVHATEWYAPGIGLVKREFGKSRTVLKSFTPGKD